MFHFLNNVESTVVENELFVFIDIYKYLDLSPGI